jgi:NAD(P)-dependent dehydrogenase (short-subunit alcohol dehydrogenase family)
MTAKFLDLKNKNVVITGGNGFLGRQITKAFLKQGSKVFILDLKVSKDRSRLKYLETNITRSEDIKKTLSFFKKNKIKIDILINNAASDHIPKKSGYKKLSLENFPDEIWDSDLAVSLTGSYLCTKILGTYMSKRGGGIILNIASDLSIIAPNQEIYQKSNFIKPISYSVTKHGIIGLTKYTASYWAKKKIRCNAIAPGGIYNNQNKDFIERIKKIIPLGRMAKKNEYNDTVLFLCSNSSSYMTGAVIISDGGRTII